MKIKILAVICIICLCVSLSACGHNNNESDTATSSSTDTTQVEAETSLSTEESAPSDNDPQNDDPKWHDYFTEYYTAKSDFDNTFTFRYGGLEYTIPNYFKVDNKYDIDSRGFYYNIDEYNNKEYFLMFKNHEDTSGIFNEPIWNIDKEKYLKNNIPNDFDLIEILHSEETNIAGLTGFKTIFRGGKYGADDEYLTYSCEADVLYDPDSNSIKSIYYIQDDLGDYSCYDDYQTILSSATITDQKDTNQFDGSTNSESQEKKEGNTSEPYKIKEYKYEDILGNTMYFISIKNNTSQTIRVSGNATAEDKSGNVIGASDIDIKAIGPGEKSLGYFYFSGVKNVKKVDYKLNYKTDGLNYRSEKDQLDIKKNVNSKNVIVTIHNKGSETFNSVQAHALFFNSDNKVIYYNSAFFSDDNFELTPDAEITQQIDAFQNFDHVKIFVDGYIFDYSDWQ